MGTGPVTAALPASPCDAGGTFCPSNTNTLASSSQVLSPELPSTLAAHPNSPHRSWDAPAPQCFQQLIPTAGTARGMLRHLSASSSSSQRPALPKGCSSTSVLPAAHPNGRHCSWDAPAPQCFQQLIPTASTAQGMLQHLSASRSCIPTASTARGMLRHLSASSSSSQQPAPLVGCSSTSVLPAAHPNSRHCPRDAPAPQCFQQLIPMASTAQRMLQHLSASSSCPGSSRTRPPREVWGYKALKGCGALPQIRSRSASIPGGQVPQLSIAPASPSSIGRRYQHSRTPSISVISLTPAGISDV